MTVSVQDALAMLNNVPPWMRQSKIRPGWRRWDKAEDDVVRTWFGKISRADLAKKVTAVSCRVTGNPAAHRTIDAIYNRANEIGLFAYNGEADEVYLQSAAKLADIPYNIVHQAAKVGDFPTQKRGKKRYVHRQDFARWFVVYREAQQTQAALFNALDGVDTISKQGAMKLAELSETQISRYLRSGVIEAWKAPEGRQGRGYWVVNRTSVETFIAARAAGRLAELLDANKKYVALRNAMTAEVKALRRKKRVGRSDPLTTPKSRYFPECFTVAQLASHIGISAQSVYRAIASGTLPALSVVKGGRARYAVELAAAQQYTRHIRENNWTIANYHNRQTRQIADAGLLTVRDLVTRWSATERAVREIAKNNNLPVRRWGRYLVFEVADIEDFERSR